MRTLRCLLLGHAPGWIPARIPNPHAITSSVWGCTRCRKVLTWQPEHGSLVDRIEEATRR